MATAMCCNNNNKPVEDVGRGGEKKREEGEETAVGGPTPKRRLFSQQAVLGGLTGAHVALPMTPTPNRAKSFSGSDCKGFLPGSPSLVSASSTDSELALEYMHELMKDKKTLECFPSVFTHIDRLLGEEISRVRMSLFQNEIGIDGMVELPEPVGDVTTLTEKLYVPHKQYPDYNFVGRILGPRGMTAKQLEQETGCKIMVRGKGSMRDKKKEEANRGKPEWEHLDDELHVLLQCEDTENRAKEKLKIAAQHVKRLLVPAPEGMDELKRKQLMELAIINGTYRPYHKVAAIQQNLIVPGRTTHRPSPSKLHLLSPARQPPAILPTVSLPSVGLSHSPQRAMGPSMPHILTSAPPPQLPPTLYRHGSHLFASSPLPSPLPPPPNTPVPPQMTPNPFGSSFFNFGAFGNDPHSPHSPAPSPGREFPAFNYLNPNFLDTLQ